MSTLKRQLEFNIETSEEVEVVLRKVAAAAKDVIESVKQALGM